jgi:hypothetical protein
MWKEEEEEGPASQGKAGRDVFVGFLRLSKQTLSSAGQQSD